MNLKANSDINKAFWNKTNIRYQRTWRSYAQQYMSDMEKAFILKYLNKTKKRNILDIGVGTGRILNFYIENAPQSNLYGIDIAEKMIDICKEQFQNYSNLKLLELKDISTETLKYEVDFDFVSCIRVLQYNANWKEIIIKIKENLAPEGVLVFSIPNSFSVNILRVSATPFFRSTPKALRDVIKESGLELLEMSSFTKLPDFLYNISDNTSYCRVLIFIETLLSKLLGKLFLGRILFVAVRRKE